MFLKLKWKNDNNFMVKGRVTREHVCTPASIEKIK